MNPVYDAIGLDGICNDIVSSLYDGKADELFWGNVLGERLIRFGV